MGVFLGLKKAFDTVYHNILLEKLKHYRINVNAYRRRFVEYNNCKSEKKQLTHGIPQGSILGLLLLIIYVNDSSMASDILFSFYLLMTQVYSSKIPILIMSARC